MNRTIEDVVETLRKAKDRNHKCTLLIGAGCSAKAGIPTAAGFVDIIRKEFPAAYRRAKNKTYPDCMSQLAVGERRDLIAHYVDTAKINWAHIAIAQLMKCGFIDRVLTTNFDPLVVRACALLGEFPAIYDFAASQLYQSADIPDQAIFYLHGQRTGFVLMNTEEECALHSELLKPVFEDAGKGRVWLVLGYSGENDPVFNHLANVKRFDWNLYWFGYKDNSPAKHVAEKLLVEGKYAFHVGGYDADDSLVTIAQQLGIFPPDVFSKPFTHLKSILEPVLQYSIPGGAGEVNVMENTLKLIQTAIDNHESRGVDTSLEDQANQLLLEGKYDEIIKLQEGVAAKSEKLIDIISLAHMRQGNAIGDLAETKAGKEVDDLFTQAAEKYAAAIKIKPNNHKAFYNWGVTLADWAETKTGKDADDLFSQAAEKYAAAIKIKPEDHEALNNWGITLTTLARTKTGKDADDFFSQATEKYAAAIKIKSDYHEAFNNWGITLSDWAKTKTNAEADDLFSKAIEKFVTAIKIKPDKSEAFNNWGIALTDWAKTKTDAEADDLFSKATEKFAAVIEIMPDDHEAFDNWGITLDDWAKTKTGTEADDLFLQATEKFATTLKIKPDFHEAFNNWGITLNNWAKIKTSTEADDLFLQATEKFAATVKIKPDYYEALNNWGNALTDWAKTKTGAEAEKLQALAEEKMAAAKQLRGTA